MTGKDISRSKPTGPVLALCGGIGGAKLALGLYRTLKADQLKVAVNTGDDFQHLGLHISPDIDTVLYTLAGLADRKRGWGRAGETWGFMRALKQLGGENWFALGDKDLATHVERTRRLGAGEPLSAITRHFAAKWGIAAEILPMSDDKVRTMIETDAGNLHFQEYFVARACQPEVRSVRYDGAASATPNARLIGLLGDPALSAVVICPSNPYLSIDPILALPGVRSALSACRAPVVAVSPIIGGRAVKGPTAKIMTELGVAADASAIADHYRGILDGFVLDARDSALGEIIQMPTRAVPSIMKTLRDRCALARQCLEFADTLRAAARQGQRKWVEMSHE